MCIGRIYSLYILNPHIISETAEQNKIYQNDRIINKATNYVMKYPEIFNQLFIGFVAALSANYISKISNI